MWFLDYQRPFQNAFAQFSQHFSQASWFNFFPPKMFLELPKKVTWPVGQAVGIFQLPFTNFYMSAECKFRALKLMHFRSNLLKWWLQYTDNLKLANCSLKQWMCQVDSKLKSIFNFLGCLVCFIWMIKPTKWVCNQQRLRSTWASAQSERVFAVHSMGS